MQTRYHCLANIGTIFFSKGKLKGLATKWTPPPGNFDHGFNLVVVTFYSIHKLNMSVFQNRPTKLVTNVFLHIIYKRATKKEECNFMKNDYVPHWINCIWKIIEQVMDNIRLNAHWPNFIYRIKTLQTGDAKSVRFTTIS